MVSGCRENGGREGRMVGIGRMGGREGRDEKDDGRAGEGRGMGRICIHKHCFLHSGIAKQSASEACALSNTETDSSSCHVTNRLSCCSGYKHMHVRLLPNTFKKAIQCTYTCMQNKCRFDAKFIYIIIYMYKHV